MELCDIYKLHPDDVVNGVLTPIDFQEDKGKVMNANIDRQNVSILL
jgi:hypothetical protein